MLYLTQTHVQSHSHTKMSAVHQTVAIECIIMALQTRSTELLDTVCTPASSPCNLGFLETLGTQGLRVRSHLLEFVHSLAEIVPEKRTREGLLYLPLGGLKQYPAHGACEVALLPGCLDYTSQTGETERV